VAAARAAFVVARDPQDRDRRLFLPTKNNVGPDAAGGLAFRMKVVETTGGIMAPMVMWDGPTDVAADEVLNTRRGRSGSATRLDDAEAFLKTTLANGPLPVRRIESEAKEAGLTMATVRRAKDALGAKTSKTALDKGWVWELPPTESG
jgi:hypothetical protein